MCICEYVIFMRTFISVLLYVIVCMYLFLFACVNVVYYQKHKFLIFFFSSNDETFEFVSSEFILFIYFFL